LDLADALQHDADDPKRKELIMRSVKHFREGLSANPSAGYSWFGLALALDVEGTKPRDAAAALMQSVDLAPNARRIATARLELLLKYEQQLTDEERPSVNRQIKTIWSWGGSYRQATLQVARNQGKILRVGVALADEPSAFEAYSKLVGEMRR
jgi:hypothetical protein